MKSGKNIRSSSQTHRIRKATTEQPSAKKKKLSAGTQIKNMILGAGKNIRNLPKNVASTITRSLSGKPAIKKHSRLEISQLMQSKKASTSSEFKELISHDQIKENMSYLEISDACNSGYYCPGNCEALFEISNRPGEETPMTRVQEALKEATRAEFDSDGTLHDPETGFQCRVFYDTEKHEVVLTFPGTECGKYGNEYEDMQGEANTTQFLGAVPKLYMQCAKATECIKENINEFPKKKTDKGLKEQPPEIVATGHSLGGGCASFAALYNGVKGVCFNTSPLGSGLMKKLGGKAYDKSHTDKITNISVEGDPVSRFWLPGGNQRILIGELKSHGSFVRNFGKLLNVLGIRTRKLPGKKLLLPNPAYRGKEFTGYKHLSFAHASHSRVINHYHDNKNLLEKHRNEIEKHGVLNQAPKAEEE